MNKEKKGIKEWLAARYHHYIYQPIKHTISVAHKTYKIIFSHDKQEPLVKAEGIQITSFTVPCEDKPGLTVDASRQQESLQAAKHSLQSLFEITEAASVMKEGHKPLDSSSLNAAIQEASRALREVETVLAPGLLGEELMALSQKIQSGESIKIEAQELDRLSSLAVALIKKIQTVKNENKKAEI